MDPIDMFWHEWMLKHETSIGVFDNGMDLGSLDVLEKHPKNSKRVKNMLSILKRGPISPYISWHSGTPTLIPQLLSFHTEDTGATLGGGAFFQGITFSFGSDSELFLSEPELPSVQASWIIQTPNKNTLTQSSKVELGI
ncbi:histone deacetylase 8 [Quercus suber]|uniref:Histone deacetylase 8 n=1 Tax=Quercus suber TaxID=58331 RepID=A0AAW0K8J3_QUESU